MSLSHRYAEWRYIPTGRVRHALRRGNDPTAICGMGVWRTEDWHGTGSQAEYEKVAQLPECGNCARLLTGDAA